MKRMKKHIGLVAGIVALAMSGVHAAELAGSTVSRIQLAKDSPKVSLSVANDSEQARAQETVEVPLAALKDKLAQATTENLAVMDGLAATWITSQTIDEDGDGQADKLIFQSDFLPKQKKAFVVFAGIDRAQLPTPALRTTARFVPERLDDFAWESDRIAYRVYGPKLWKQEGAKTGSGIDVWCKHVRDPIVDAMYKRPNYHADDGRGVDFYNVGSSRGCGGIGILAGERLWTSRCFAGWKLLSAGPIRAAFELQYDEWDVAGRKVSETKRISIDLGSNLNRIESVFKADGGDPLQVAVGLANYKGAVVANGEGWATVWDLRDKKNGAIGIGAVLPGAKFKLTADHALLLASVTPGQPLVYYAGAGWSRSPDFKDEKAWNDHVKEFLARVKSPLKVTGVTRDAD